MIKTPDGQPLEPQFDWYQFSTQTDIRLVREVLDPLAKDDPFHPEKPKLKGYGWAIKTGGPGGSCLIHFGGKNGDEFGPNVQGTGPLSPAVADLFRASRIRHGVGRADVRIDFLGDFERCRLQFIERCNQAGVSTSDNGSSPESIVQKGRTVYGGARTSFYQPTLYQKGLQLGDDFPENYLRLEHRFAPTKATEKAQLSELTPSQMVGLRPISRDLSHSIAELVVQPYTLTKQPKEKNTYHWMLSQYQKLLREMLDDAGSDECFGKQIAHDLRQMKEAERAEQ